MTMDKSIHRPFLSVLSLAGLLTACNYAAGTTAPASQPSRTGATAAIASAATSQPPTAQASPTSTALLATPTPTPTVPATPAPIRANAPESFQILRESDNQGRLALNTYAMALSPDTRILAIAGCAADENLDCSNKPAFELLDMETGQVIQELDPRAPVIQQLAFSPDGVYLAAAGCNLPLYLVGEPDTNCNKPEAWIVDVSTGQVRAEMKGFTSVITGLAWSPDGSRLYTGVRYATAPFDNDDNEISVFDASTGKRLLIVQPKVTNGSEMSLQVTPDGRFLIMDLHSLTASPSFVQWWNIEDPDHPASVHVESPALNHYLSPDGTKLITRNEKDNTLRLFDTATGQALHAYPHVAGEFEFESAQFLDNERLLVVSNGKLNVVDLAGGNMTALKPTQGRVYRHFLSPDGRILLTSGIGAGPNGGLTSRNSSLWDTQTWTEYPLTSLEGEDPSWCSRTGAFSPDSTRFVCAAEGATPLYVWGSAPPEQANAKGVLLDFLGRLADGDLAGAADHLSMQEQPVDYRTNFSMSTLATVVPEADPGNLQSMLAVLCADPVYPCRPVKGLVYQGQLADGLFLFAVDFAMPDGSLAAWPPCQDVDPKQYCDHRDGVFEYVVERQSDGTFKVVNGMPPSANLR